MKVAGIIVEYNPLHYGHQLHLERTRSVTSCDAVVAVMSGGFTQRGEPAVFSKWARTEMALHAGCDLVIELPSAYAVQPAEWFAHGAVSLLHATGIVKDLVFGSESGTIDILLPLAKLLSQETPEFQKTIRSYLDEGISYPAAISRAAVQSGLLADEHASLLSEPNNTLGLQYLIALQRLGSSIRPFTITREQSHYHDIQPSHHQIASATAIRRMLLQEPGSAAAYLPPATAAVIQSEIAAGRGPVHLDQLWMSLLQIITTSTPADLQQYYDMSEGIEHRLLKVLPGLDHCSISALIDALKTKRYTRARLQRLVAHLLLGHRRDLVHTELLHKGPGYLRILGFNAAGQQLLKQMKKTASLPMITRPADTSHPHMELDIRATVMQAAGYRQQTIQTLYSDIYHAPVRI